MRRSLIIGILLILLLTLLIWGASKALPSLLPDTQYNDLVFLLVVLVSVVGLLSNLRSVIDLAQSFSPPEKLAPLKESQSQRNRRNMLQLVRSTWIEGLLEKSVHREAWIDLGLELRPEALEYPWEMQRLVAGDAPQVLPPGIKMIDLFNRASGGLLILGEPGSGKTTMLLELARQLIEQAAQDEAHPIPVVFNLASWSAKQTFSGWLVSELRSKYYTPLKVAVPWVENDELLLLLDGLDEVKAEDREACVSAINDFCDRHAVSLAVCCRQQEYEALSTPLKLHEAVRIQPLSRRQASEYLRKGGKNLEVVRRMVENDPELQEFASTPLILSILMLTFQNAAPKTVQQTLEASGDYRSRLFDAYIQQMFRRRPAGRRFDPGHTRRALGWLAQKMQQRGQMVFYLEDIRPGWVGISQVKLWLVMGLFVGLAFGLVGLLTGWLIFGLASGWLSGLVGGLIFGLASGLVGGLTFGLVLGLGAKNWADRGPTERLHWSGRDAWLGLLVGLAGGLIGGLIGSVFAGIETGLRVGLGAGLFVGLVSGLNGSATENRSVPGEGVRASLRNALVFGLLFWLFFGLIFGLFVGGLQGLVIGVVIGLVVGFFLYGGSFLIYHLLSRWTISRSVGFPWQVLPFLDHCANLIFLRRVGGGYIFIHRMLMEHFAEMRPGRPSVRGI